MYYFTIRYNNLFFDILEIDIYHNIHTKFLLKIYKLACLHPFSLIPKEESAILPQRNQKKVISAHLNEHEK